MSVFYLFLADFDWFVFYFIWRMIHVSVNEKNAMMMNEEARKKEDQLEHHNDIVTFPYQGG